MRNSIEMNNEYILVQHRQNDWIKIPKSVLVPCEFSAPRWMRLRYCV